MDDYDYMGEGIDWQRGLEAVGGVFGSIAKTAGEFYTAKQNLRNQRELNAVNLETARLGNTLKVAEAAGAVDIARAQIAASVARSNAAGYIASPAGLSLSTVALLAVGAVVLMKFAK